MIHTGTLQTPTIKDNLMVATNFWVEVTLTPLNPLLQPFSQKDPGTINLPIKVKTPNKICPSSWDTYLFLFQEQFLLPQLYVTSHQSHTNINNSTFTSHDWSIKIRIHKNKKKVALQYNKVTICNYKPVNFSKNQEQIFVTISQLVLNTQQSIWELRVTLYYLIYKVTFNLIHKWEKNQLCLLSYHERKD